MVTITALLSTALFVIGFCWSYGYERLIIDFIFWYDPTYPGVTKFIVIGLLSIVAPITLLVRYLDLYVLREGCYISQNSFLRCLKFHILGSDYSKTRRYTL